MVGYVWPEGKTVFPDFFKNRTQEWWIKQIRDHYENTLKFDGYLQILTFCAQQLSFTTFYLNSPASGST